MRIIAGELKSRRLVSPKNNDVRPTTDKVKEAVFSMIIPYLSEGCVVCDVFAGSGNLGIEAISRGAGKAYFSDFSRESVRLVVENLKLCGVEDRAVVLQGDFKRNIARIKEPVDVFFVDPPYADEQILPALCEIDRAGNCRPGGIVVCEHRHRDEMPEKAYGFTAIKAKRYGATGVTIYERDQESDA